MFANGIRVETEDLEEAFAELFESKIKLLSDNARITDNVYKEKEKAAWNWLFQLHDRSQCQVENGIVETKECWRIWQNTAMNTNRWSRTLEYFNKQTDSYK